MICVKVKEPMETKLNTASGRIRDLRKRYPKEIPQLDKLNEQFNNLNQIVTIILRGDA